MGSTLQRRAMFDQLRRLYPKNSGAVVSWGALRCDSDLTATAQQVINLQPLTSGGTAKKVTENRLNQNDMFAVVETMVFLYKFTVSGGDAARAAAKLYTAPNPQVFTTGSANLESVYNGGLSWLANTVQIVPFMDMAAYRRVGNPIELVAQTVTAGIAGTAISYFTNDFADNQSWLTQDEMFIFGGQSNIQININLPASVDLRGSTDGTVYNCVAFYMRGFLIQNVQGDMKQIVRD